MNFFKSNQKFKLYSIVIIISLTVIFSGKKPEYIGDNLQIALPVLGFACSVTNGQSLEYFARFIIMEVGLHSSKIGLGEIPLNERPSGGYRGFPSGHTSAAFFGASSLVHHCITSNIYVKGLVLLSAAFVGGSRIEADKHTTFQVICGIIWGWATQMAFRRRESIIGRFRKS